jgi:hypothetical protein
MPATSKFLRDRRHTQSFHLIVRSADHCRIGLDASVWGVLPSLTNFCSLRITYSKDISPSLAEWLIPQTLRAFTMGIMVPPVKGFLFINVSWGFPSLHCQDEPAG